MKMSVDEARRLLNLPPASDGMVTPQQVRTAFRRAVRSAHPDTGGNELEASDLVTRLGDARQLLLDAVDNTCPQCRGAGHVKTGGRFQMSKVCMYCDGSGEQL